MTHAPGISGTPAEGTWPSQSPALLALGPLSMSYVGRTSSVGGPKQQLVLALLLEAAGRCVPIDRLIDGVWNSDPPSAARGAIHSYLSNLRRTLGDVMAREGNSYKIRVTPGNFDILRFEDLVRSARRVLDAEPARGADLIRSALMLWRGDPYSGLTDCPVLHSEAARLEELRIGAIEDCLDSELRSGANTALVGELEVLVEAHPFRERLVGQLMLALYRSGRSIEALDVLRQARRTFREEFGLDVSPDLQILEETILNQSDA